ncbi:MAG TPA: helix-turn-helix transcriptional regulator [Solirubrobacteraceae bacterium]|jgi:transcriptional regulator with XRE-family HTH domain|nr:helix-turn-helix transcriptional regulator [Solirubrobacteraceae bacterium]
MRLDLFSTDQAVLGELGQRLARHRLARNMTQAELAAQAGLGKATVQRVERGESAQIGSLVKLLRALELLDGFDAALPESIELPIARLEREQRRGRSRVRRRARARRTPADESAAQPWRWGEERDGGPLEQHGQKQTREPGATPDGEPGERHGREPSGGADGEPDWEPDWEPDGEPEERT